MSEKSKKQERGLRDLFKASWMRSSIKLAIVATIAGVILIWLLKIFNFGGLQFFSDMESFFVDYGLAGIFFATIVAGTIIPLGSPALVVAAALFDLNPISLILIASAGFTIGMTINYYLAHHFGRPFLQRRVSAEHLEEMTFYWKKWGWPLYFIFGLIPVFPVELISFVCGFLETRIATFLVLSFIPRLIVFAILVYFGQNIATWIGAV
jgi:membrane protein YqaA with SNARE-associated domain